jgi:hypothetical protein
VELSRLTQLVHDPILEAIPEIRRLRDKALYMSRPLIFPVPSRNFDQLISEYRKILRDLSAFPDYSGLFLRAMDVEEDVKKEDVTLFAREMSIFLSCQSWLQSRSVKVRGENSNSPEFMDFQL